MPRRRRRRVTRKREFADVCHHSSDAHISDVVNHTKASNSAQDPTQFPSNFPLALFSCSRRVLYCSGTFVGKQGKVF
jgi:hypothetical protein